MHCRFPLLFVAAALLPSLAFAQKIRVDYDHAADFTKYKTYKWVEVKDSQKVSQLAAQRITNAMEAQLAQEGLTKTDDNPDVLVDYQVAVTQKTQLTTYGSGGGPGWGYGPRYGYGWGGTGISTTTSSTIPVGTLVVDFMDPNRKQLVFRGIAEDTLSDKPEKNADKIQKAVKKIFEKYPPKSS